MASPAYVGFGAGAVLGLLMSAGADSRLGVVGVALGSWCALALVVLALLRLVKAKDDRKPHGAWLLVGFVLVAGFVLLAIPGPGPFDYRG